MHRPHAGLFAGVHACICLMLTCSPACTPASASCWLVRRRARMHRPHAGLFAGVHACIGLMLTCSLACTHASALCRLVRRRAGVHRPHPDLFIDIHACIGLRAELHNGVHASIDLDRACREVSSDCRGGCPAVMQVDDLTVLDRAEHHALVRRPSWIGLRPASDVNRLNTPRSTSRKPDVRVPLYRSADSHSPAIR